MWKFHYFVKKVEGIRTRLHHVKKNYFPNVNFKLIFKLDKASLSEIKSKGFSTSQRLASNTDVFRGVIFPQNSLEIVCVGGYVEIGQ